MNSQQAHTNSNGYFLQISWFMLLFYSSNVQIQIIIKFGTAKSINTYLNAKIIPTPHKF